MITVRFSVQHPRLGAYVVDLPCYQWEYTDGGDFLFQDLGATEVGVVYFDPLDTERQFRVMPFILTDILAAKLKTLTTFAHRFVRDVRFWPDYTNAPGTYWDLDWETEISFSQQLDNRPTVPLKVVMKVA